MSDRETRRRERMAADPEAAERRREQNRLAAKRYRNRKRAMSDLEERAMREAAAS